MSQVFRTSDLLRAPGFAPHAISERPAWLFAPDGQRLLFANAAGAALFGYGNSHAAADTPVERADIAKQIARSAAALTIGGAPRLECLRGLASGLPRPLICNCSKIASPWGPAILLVATETSGPALTQIDRVQRLLAGCDEALAAFDADGVFIWATEAAEHRINDDTRVADILASADIMTIGEGADAVMIVAPHPAENTSREAQSPESVAGPDDVTTVDLRPIADAMATMSLSQNGPANDAAQPDPGPAANDTTARRRPLRFAFETDADNRFRITSAEFLALAGPRTVNLLGRFWGEISAKLALDPEGFVAHAIMSRDTWSGITVHWPIATGERIAVELSAIPAFDRERIFRGYHGTGVWRDRIQDEPADAPLSQDGARHSSAPSENVVPFRAGAPDTGDRFGPGEPTAFHELASRLTARLRGADEVAKGPITPGSSEVPLYGASYAQGQAALDLRPHHNHLIAERPILDRLPFGVLIYQLDQFLYANPAFLKAAGHVSLGDFAQAGGLNSLLIEPGSRSADLDEGQSLRIALRNHEPPIAGRLFSAPLDGEQVMVLLLSDHAPQQPAAGAYASDAQTSALASILDMAADGVVVLDREGRILEANAGAESLFGYDARDFAGRQFSGLFAPGSERLVMTRLERLVRGAEASAADEAREIIGRRRQGGWVPLHLILGRIDEGDERFCAVFRDISKWKDAEQELIAARRQAEQASTAKSEFLAKVSHEMRTPLNAIIGFSEVMMEERFGPVGNERYRDYLKDINASGSHLVSLLNDLIDLSKIEAGKLELSFERVNLNDLTQQSVAIMQAEANRSRIIVRTALSMNAPSIVADARSVRQIILNLLSNSIKFTGTGGQVIVSTAATEDGAVMLRVRDTGVGMSAAEIETALQPFRQLNTTPRSDANGTGLGLPLTKALVEANRARFSIKSTVNAGTLIEVVFPPARVLAE